jgi:hypothetical protein
VFGPRRQIRYESFAKEAPLLQRQPAAVDEVYPEIRGGWVNTDNGALSHCQRLRGIEQRALGLIFCLYCHHPTC